MENKYYTPKIEEFHSGFRYERKPADYNIAGKNIIESEWIKCTYCLHEDGRRYSNFMLNDFSIRQDGKEFNFKGVDITDKRVKYLDKADIEELGWVYTGKTTELWFGIPKADVRPFNLTYRSFMLSYNTSDNRLRITGYAYENYKVENEDEILFLGKIKNYNELKKLMGQIGIIR